MICTGGTRPVSTGLRGVLIGGRRSQYANPIPYELLGNLADMFSLQWACGVGPSMPGFISNVNNNAHVSIGWTRLYYMSFLVGFSIAAVIYVTLHRLLPAPSVKDFVMSPATKKQVMRESQAKWDG